MTLNFSRGLRVLFLLLPMGLGACMGASGPELPVDRMSDAEFRAASDEAKQAYLNELDVAPAELATKHRKEYLAGMPVRIGDAATSGTLQWNRLTQMATFYPGHDPKGIDGVNTELAIVMATDEAGNIRFMRDQVGNLQPMAIMKTYGTQEDIGRVAVKGAFSVLAGAANNLGVGIINAATACDNCGGPENVVVNNNSGDSVANSLAETATTIDQRILAGAARGCPSGNCGVQ